MFPLTEVYLVSRHRDSRACELRPTGVLISVLLISIWGSLVRAASLNFLFLIAVKGVVIPTTHGYCED